MKQILASHGIKTVHFFDSKGVARNYVFSNKMLANNIFIEHFSLDLDELEEIAEDEDFEVGSQLSVVMEHKGKVYQFLMYHGSYEIGVPLMVLQTIIFLTNLIDKSDPDILVTYFNSIATDPLVPHEIPDKKFRVAANEMIKLKIQTIHELIEQGRIDSN